MTRHLIYSVVLTLFVAFLATSVFAQSDDTLAYSVALGDVVVTGQMRPTRVDESMRKIQVLTQEDLRGRGFVRLDEVLAREVTLRVSPDPILGSGLSIGGLGGQNVQILIDGMPVVGRLGGNVDLGQIDMSRIARVEIVPGAMSTQYGSNASGGVINLITKREQAGRVSAEVFGQYETAGLRNTRASAGVQLGEWQVGLGANMLHTDFGPIDSLRVRTEVILPDSSTARVAPTPWNPKHQEGYHADLAWRPSDSIYMTYRHRGFSEVLDLIGEVKRPQFRPYVQDQRFTTERADDQLLGEVWLGPRNYLKGTVGYNRFDRYKMTTRLDLEPDTTSAVPGGADTTRYTALLGRAFWTHTFSKNWELQVGGEFLRESAAGGRIRDTLTGDLEPVIDNVAGWVQATYRPCDWFSASTSLRAGYNNRYDHPVVPSMQVRIQLDDRTILRGSYAASFRAPSVQELFFEFIDLNHYIVGNRALAAEHGHHMELDLTRSFPVTAGGEIKMGLRLFENQLRDRITLTAFETGRFSYSNIDRYATRGLVASAELRGYDRWRARLSAGQTLVSNSLRNEAAENGQDIEKWMGQLEASAMVSYRIPKLEVDALIDYRGFGERIRFVDAGIEGIAEQSVGAYHLINFTLSRDFKLYSTKQGQPLALRLNLGVKDLFDVESVDVVGATSGDAHSGGTSQQLVGFGRNGFVGVALAF